ncbi:hypothetical protein ACMFMG_004956 [Clarireedia jacksonii]
MTEQHKAGYHIISDAEDFEDGKETIRKFYAEHRRVTIPSDTHTIISKIIEIPEEVKGILWTYHPDKSPGTMEIGVWYPESDFTYNSKYLLRQRP